MEIFSKLGWFFKQEKKSYSIGIFLLVCVSILSGFIPLIIGKIIDDMTNGSLERHVLYYWILGLLIIYILLYVMRYFWRTKIFGTSAKLAYILRQRLFNHFTKMDAEFFQRHRTGDLMAHATNDVGMVRMVAGSGILTLVDSLSQGLMTIVMMFIAIDWKLSIVAILPLPLLAVIIRFNGKRVHYYFRFAQEAFSSLNDKVQESITGIKVIKSFGEESLDLEDFKKMTHFVVEKNKDAYRYDALFRPSIQIVMGLSSVLSLFYGSFLVEQQHITVGALVAFLYYVTRMGWPMIAVGQLFNILERGSVSYQRIEDILREKSSIMEITDPIEEGLSGDISIKIDAFSYDDKADPVLKNIHFDIPHGATIGVVGRTGAGKTTLFKLLMRDYDVQQGNIQYNGHSIREIALNALSEMIGYVPQDNFLFSTTIRDNIRFAQPDASQEVVEQAAKLTNVHEDILGFPQGYDTLVGERGVALSGGQKQRVSMARAMLIEPELLILDDSLSAVDAKTEKKILDAIKSTRQNKTTIISAHRISSVMHSDLIIVIEDGTIVERGTHEMLMQQSGWYKKMYDIQQLEEEIDDELQAEYQAHYNTVEEGEK